MRYKSYVCKCGAKQSYHGPFTLEQGQKRSGHHEIEKLEYDEIKKKTNYCLRYAEMFLPRIFATFIVSKHSTLVHESLLFYIQPLNIALISFELAKATPQL